MINNFNNFFKTEGAVPRAEALPRVSPEPERGRKATRKRTKRSSKQRNWEAIRKAFDSMEKRQGESKTTLGRGHSRTKLADKRKKYLKQQQQQKLKSNKNK